MNKPTTTALVLSAALVTLGGVLIFNPVEPNFNKSWFDEEDEIVGNSTDEDIVNLTLVTYQNFTFNARYRYPQEWTVRETENTVTFYIDPPETEDAAGDFFVEFLNEPGRDFAAEFSGEEFYSEKVRDNDTLYHFRRKDEASDVWISFYFYQKEDRVVAIQHATEHPYVGFFNVMVNSVEFDFWDGEEIKVVHPEDEEVDESDPAEDEGVEVEG